MSLSGGCGEDVFKVWGGDPEGVWRLSVGCGEAIRRIWNGV